MRFTPLALILAVCSCGGRIAGGGEHDAEVASFDGGAVETPPEVEGGTLVPPTAVAEVVAGFSHACARLVDGRVACWAYPDPDYPDEPAVAPLSASSSATIVPVDHVTSLTASAGSGDVFCATRDDGGVRCWGRLLALPLPYNPKCEDCSSGIASIELPFAAARLAFGDTFACALRTDGGVACVDTISSFDHQFVDVAGVVGAVNLTVGARHACATLADGSARCWGDGAFGQLAGMKGVWISDSIPLPAFAGARSLITAGHNTCLVRADGELQCAGLDSDCELGAPVAVASPTDYAQSAILVRRPRLERVARVALMSSQAPIQSIFAMDLRGCAVRDDGSVRCFRSGLGDARCEYAPALEFEVPIAAVGVSTGFNHACSTRRDEIVTCWNWPATRDAAPRLHDVRW